MLQNKTLPSTRPRLTHFDRAAVGAVAAMALLIALTIGLGDRVGITIARVAPLGEGARSTSPLSIAFSENMNRESAQTRFRTEPALVGAFRWNGRQMLFQPSTALMPGQTYMAILEAGATSDNGRAVLDEYRYSFTIRTPRVAYLFPSTTFPQNVWIADPTDPASAQQLTFSPTTVYDFSVSPDGGRIAFSEKNSNGTSNIKLLDLETGGLVQLTNCPDSDCTTPVWRPDGQVIAYERVDFNTDLNAVGQSPTRIWLIDLATITPTTPAANRPLFSDSQYLGFSAQWSADGTRIALFNAASQGEILVYDFTDNNITAIPSTAGDMSALSPNGRRVVYPETVFQEGQSVRAFLRIANLDTGEITVLSDPSQPVDDRRARWRPDGEMLAVARTTESTGRGYQIYLVNPEDGTSQALTDDTRYSNQLFLWDPTGRQLVVQRFPELDANGLPNNLGLPEIWTLDVETGALTEVVENGYLPRWVP